MSTCAKRSVLQAGDRPGRVRRAALEVQAAVNEFQRRQLPATGGMGRPLGMQLTPRNGLQPRPIGLGSMDPMTNLARAVGGLSREVADTLALPQGPLGWSGGRTPNGGNGPNGGYQPAPGGGGSTIGGSLPTPGIFVDAAVLIGTYEAPYTEPMMIPLPPNFTPVAIIAARIQAMSDITRYFRSGVACDWMPYGNRVLLRAIDGMTIGDPTVLTYTFIYYGVSNA